MPFTTDHLSTAKFKQGISTLLFWSFLVLILLTTACNKEPDPDPAGNSDLHRFGTYLNCPNLLSGTYNGVELKGHANHRDLTRQTEPSCVDLAIMNFDPSGLVQRWELRIVFDSTGSNRLQQAMPSYFGLVNGNPSDLNLCDLIHEFSEGEARAILTRWTGGSDTEPWPQYTIDSSPSNFVRIDSVAMVNGSLDNPGSQMFGELSLRFKLDDSQSNREYVDWARRIGAHVPETMVFENVAFTSHVWVTRLDNECPF